MKKRIIEIKPGSVLMYKDYPWFKRLWAKLTKKELPFNCYFFPAVTQEVMLEGSDKDMVIYEPIKKYNKKETEKLLNLCWDFSEDLDEIALIINQIRPNTISEDELDFESNKYYKAIDVTQETGKTCY